MGAGLENPAWGDGGPAVDGKIREGVGNPRQADDSDSRRWVFFKLTQQFANIGFRFSPCPSNRTSCHHVFVAVVRSATKGTQIDFKFDNY